MTFRSFSRFVRWYRWPLRVSAAVSVPFLFCDSWWYAPLMFGAYMFILSPLVGLSERVTNARNRAERLARNRLRAMPLRGWTK